MRPGDAPIGDDPAVNKASTEVASSSERGEGVLAARVGHVARYLLDCGKVVPSIEVGEGVAARSWWLPFPGATDRAIVASLLAGDVVEEHVRAAGTLAVEVDRLARERLVSASVRLVARRPGRRTVPHAWLDSLTSLDPRLPTSLPAERVAAFAARIGEWVASGAATLGRARLCLRVHEPGRHPDAPATAREMRAEPSEEEPWRLALLLQDADEPSLMVPIADLWAGRAPFPTGSVEEVLRTLARAVAVAPPLAGLLDEAAPVGLAMELGDVLDFVERHVEPLTEIGVPVLLPSWWQRRRRVSLRARASSPGTKGAVSAAGLDFDTVVSFRWEAALGDHRLTKAELRELERAAEAKVGLVQVRGEWVQVDASELQAVIARVGSAGKASARELLRASLGLADLHAGGDGSGSDHGEADGAFGNGLLGGAPVDVVAAGRFGELLSGARDASMVPVATPPGFEGRLRPYQERGVGWLVFLGRLGSGACLADDMGLGKTAQLIASLLADPAPGPTLVVCPVSVLGNWAREIERFAPALTVLAHHGRERFDDDGDFASRAHAHDVVLTTYSLVARDVDHLREVEWGRVVLDEAQQVKNPSTATARAVRQLAAPRRVALTGTPVENRLAELWSIMQFLNPGLLGSLTSFTKRFAGPIERDDDPEAAELLRRLVGPFLLRRLKADKAVIDDLPDKIEQTERCVLTREQATLYQAVVDDLLAAADREQGIGRSGAILAGIAKLKQVCNHPAHFLADGSALPGRSGKLDRVEELLDEIVTAGDKVLCFTQFAGWGERLVPHLARRYGTEPLWLHGGVSRRRREQLLERFSDPAGPPVFLLSLKAGGTGLNLTAASHVVHLDRWWNPAVEDQATDRAYRIGQRRSVHVHKLVTAGTIEERIDEMITAKRRLAERVVGSGEQWITKLDTAALREVVALRDAEVV